jgi:hypothetical protein
MSKKSIIIAGCFVFVLFILPPIINASLSKRSVKLQASAQTVALALSPNNVSTTGDSRSTGQSVPTTNPSNIKIPTPPSPTYVSTAQGYTAPTANISAGSTFVAPDPTKCPAIKTQISVADATLLAQNQQLNTDIQNYQNYISNNNQTYILRGFGPSPTEQASDSRDASLIQIDQAKVIANANQINMINAPYAIQLGANQCA